MDTKGKTWQERKSKLKITFTMLTENDLLLEEGSRGEMMGKLQVKLGKTKEEVQRILAAI